MDDEGVVDEETDGVIVLGGTENAVTEELCKSYVVFVLEEDDESDVGPSCFKFGDFVIVAVQGVFVW